MALYQRRDSVGRTRFLLALTLSTVTAVGVAAPLALQALNSEEPTFAAVNPDAGETAVADESQSDADSRSLEAEVGGMGGIRSEPGPGDVGDDNGNDPAASNADGSSDVDGSPAVEVVPATPRPMSPSSTSTIAAGSSSPHPDGPGATDDDQSTTTTEATSTSTTEVPAATTSSTTEAPPITNGETSSTTSTSEPAPTTP